MSIYTKFKTHKLHFQGNIKPQTQVQYASPMVSVIIPVFNAEQYLKQSIPSVLQQSWQDFELILVNDGSTDNSLSICQQFTDPRIKIINQTNRGLAGARNTGIRNAKGEFIALLDADDLWHQDKLHHHLKHLNNNPLVGVSYCPSQLMDDNGKDLGLQQSPKLEQVSKKDILCRNPVGNGSAPVIRKQVFNDIAFYENLYGQREVYYFDDTFRQSEDIECWVRIAGTTQWQFEGIPLALTWYRINDSGLSANLGQQLNNWQRMIDKTKTYAPELYFRFGALAKAYQLRYLARRAIRSRSPVPAAKLLMQALSTQPMILVEEPKRTLTTLFACTLQLLLPLKLYQNIEHSIISMQCRKSVV